MYEARQNKEKVSRRIEDNGNGARQRVDFEDGRGKYAHLPYANMFNNIGHIKNKSTIVQRVTSIFWDTQSYLFYDRAGTRQTIEFGKSMEAHLDANDPRRGSTPGNGLQADARNDAQTNNNGPMVLGHLLNDNLGGPGLSFNLYPISVIANAEHSASVETHIKNKIARNLNNPGDPNNNTHVEYTVDVTPATGVGNGGSRHIGGSSPDATIVCNWRSFEQGVWQQWNTKTITSIAGDDYLSIIQAGWYSLGKGQRANNLYFGGGPNPDYIEIYQNPINIGGVNFSLQIQERNGTVIGYVI